MKMGIVVVGLVCSFAVFADESGNAKKRPSRLVVREKRIAAAGGLVTRPAVGKEILIVNDQKRVAEKDFFFDDERSIQGMFGYPVRVVPAKTDVSEAGLVITLSDNNQAPALLVAPEVPWAGVNVGALAADNPKQDVLVKRVQKEIWRAFLYAGGAANSVEQPCIMRVVRRPHDLDAYPNLLPRPEALPRIANTAKALGIGERETCTYRQACQEGWAPAPTNDIQKAIYDEVKAPPKNPMKIEFDPKKGR